MKKILILGGAGLIAGNLAKHLTDMAGYEVYRVDIVDRPRPGLEHTTFIKMNVLQKGKVTNLIADMQPSIIVNGINVATIFSDKPTKGYGGLVDFYIDLYKGMLSMSHPFHYVQLGTTGSGGLGLNIPFTHGAKIEHLPIIHKAAFAGITTSMLTLLSRSLPDGASISEIKPGLSIFADQLTHSKVGDAELVVLDGGESGDYTYNELALLTSFMGFTTVSKIVDKVLAIISHQQKHDKAVAYDTVAAMNATIVGSEADDLEIRNRFLQEMLNVQGTKYVIATGKLGPPTITRDLLLAYMRVKRLGDHPDAFKYAFSMDPCIQATLGYIKSHDSKLYKFLMKDCNFENYGRLSEYYVTGMDHAWQVVRAKLQS